MYQTNYTGIIYFTALCFLVLPRLCDLYKLRICDNAESSKSIDTSFQTAFSHLASPCLGWVFHSVSDFPPVSCFGDLWAVAFHGHIVIVLVQQAPCPRKMMNMTDKHSVCLDSPPSITPRLPLLRLPIHRTQYRT